MLFQGSTTSRLLRNGRQERGIAVSTWLFDADSQVELLKQIHQLGQNNGEKTLENSKNRNEFLEL